MKKSLCALSIILATGALAQAGERSLDLQGSADPKISKIEVTTTFTTNSMGDPFCTEPAMMILIPKSVTKTVAATIDADGRYSVQVPMKGHLDWDFLNICRARPSSILIEASGSDSRETSYFISLDGSEHGPINVDLALDSSQQ